MEQLVAEGIAISLVADRVWIATREDSRWLLRACLAGSSDDERARFVERYSRSKLSVERAAVFLCLGPWHELSDENVGRGLKDAEVVVRRAALIWAVEKYGADARERFRGWMPNDEAVEVVLRWRETQKSVEFRGHVILDRRPLDQKTLDPRILDNLPPNPYWPAVYHGLSESHRWLVLPGDLR